MLQIYPNDIVISIKKRFKSKKSSKREDQYKEQRLSYLTFFLIYHQWAYYLCCIPYKFVKDEKGKYKIQKFKLQQICSLIQSIFYVYAIFKYCISKWIELVTSDYSPVAYLGIVESTWYLHFAFIAAYLQLFGGISALRFLKKLDSYSRKHPLEFPAKSSGTFVKLPAKKWFVHILMCCLALLSLNDFCLQSNFKFDTAQNDSYDFLLWSKVNDEKFSRPLKLFLLVTYIVIQSLANIRVMYNELYFLAGTITFWMISCDFENSVIKICDLVKDEEVIERKPLLEFKECVCKYRRISKLCRLFNKAYGYAMFSHIASYQMYYAMGFDRLFINTSSLGVKFYEMEFLIGFGLIYGLGLRSSHKMTCLKRLLDDVHILSKLTPRRLNVAWHWVRTNYCAIRAKTFPLTFSAFNQFIAQIMVVFLIAIQIKMMNANGGFGPKLTPNSENGTVV